MEQCSLLLHLSERCQSMLQLKLIHGHLLRHHISNHIILSKLILFAAVSSRGDLRYATLLFSHHRHHRSSGVAAFFYNTLIRGYANTSSPSLSFSLFVSMRRRTIPPDHFTFTFLLKALARFSCSSEYDDTSIHAQVFKFGCMGSQRTDVYVHNALIHFYASLARTDAARQVLDEMPLRPDAVSWSGVLNAHLRAGDLNSARDVFDRMIPIEQRDVVSWTAMIAGCLHVAAQKGDLHI